MTSIILNQNKINSISFDPKRTILEAIKMMDDIQRKLLLVLDNGTYIGVLSIGDIQRALLKNQDFNTPIKHILRVKNTVGRVNQTKEEIKNLMLSLRTEFMPILNDQDELVNIVFWDDFFEEQRVKSPQVDIPVVVMAGGKGTRLKPITNIIPKPLIPLGNKTILEIIIDSFKNLGSTNFYLSVNYKADMIKNYFNEINNLDVNIDYFIEDKPLGTAGSLHLLGKKINTTFFVSNCDILIDQDYYEILDYHKKNNNEITLVAAIKNFNIPYGTIEVGKDGLVKELKEKPSFTYYVNAGMYILEPHLLNEIPENQFFHITHLIDKILERKGRVGIFPVSAGSWSDIGEWDKYKSTLNKFGHSVW